MTHVLASGRTYTYNWQYIEASQTWQLTYTDGLKIVTKSEIWNSGHNELVETLVTSDSSGAAVSVTKSHYKLYPFGLRKISEVRDPSGAAITTDYQYYEDSSQTGRYGHKKSMTKSDGYWETYDYDSKGRMIQKVTPFLDSPAGTSASNAKTYYFSYTVAVQRL